MLGIGLEEKILERIVKNTGDSAIVFSRIFPRVFLHIKLKFTFDGEELFVEMCILLSLIILGPCVRGAKMEKNEVINHMRPFYGM